ncbi:MAG: leucyl/phenylalanyl-tRNA--protein transferase [Bryobacterales bacterium]|nr:leucyl/phenylalanyl-tRNA--protein transferase [Bryobacterales bacterium]
MVLENYAKGLFPMGNPGFGIVTWHSPNPRAIIPLDGFHVSRSLARTLRQARFRVSFDDAFGDVIRACGERDGHETWITDEIRETYEELHRRGHAHSVEVWMDNRLAGGVYGVQIGGAFFAESKFHRERDMSKAALSYLVTRLRERGFDLLEVQYLTPHLRSLGAIEIQAREYMRRLEAALKLSCRFVGA